MFQSGIYPQDEHPILWIFAVRVFPLIRNTKKGVVTVLPDETQSLLVLFVFVTLFGVKIVNGIAIVV
jgi:hypothetical protein